MKRTKLMLGVAALSAALLGTGYAAMTDTLLIGGNVSTANFCVDFEGLTPASPAAERPEDFEMTTEATLSEDQHTINFDINNLQPGVPVTYETTIVNNSSLKALLDVVNVKFKEDAQEMAKNIKFTMIMDKGGDKEAIFKGTLGGMVSSTLSKMTLAPDETVPVEITLNWTENEGAIHAKDSTELSFELQLDWTQASASETQVAVNPEN